MKRTEELILLYHFNDEKEEKVKSLLESMKIKSKEISDDMFQQKVGYLVGLPTFKETVSVETLELLDEEVMLIYGLNNKRMNQLLLKFQAEDIQIALKAVVTPLNRFWSFARLCKAVQKENQMMTIK